MERQYYFYDGAERIGPVNYNELGSRRVRPDMLYWYEGLPDWKKGYELPELANIFTVAAPPTMPPPVNQQMPPIPVATSQPQPHYQPGPAYTPQYQPGPDYVNAPLQPTPPAYEWYLGAWRKYAQFTGRARRSEYWYFVLFNAIVVGALIVFNSSQRNYYDSTDFGMAYNVYQLAALIPSLALGVRRMHDVGKSGWFLLIPFYNLILACTEGNRGPNEYGPDPKYVY